MSLTDRFIDLALEASELPAQCQTALAALCLEAATPAEITVSQLLWGIVAGLPLNLTLSDIASVMPQPELAHAAVAFAAGRSTVTDHLAVLRAAGDEFASRAVNHVAFVHRCGAELHDMVLRANLGLI